MENQLNKARTIARACYPTWSSPTDAMIEDLAQFIIEHMSDEIETRYAELKGGFHDIYCA